MITPMDMYILTRLDGVCTLFGVTTFVCALILIFGVSAFPMWSESENRTSTVGWMRRAFVVGFISALINVFIPSTKEAVAIYVVPAIANNESVRAIPETAVKMADEWLKGELDKLMEKKKK